MKLHALLHLIDEHMDDIAAGMPITEDHFITVLDSFTFHPEVLSSTLIVVSRSKKMMAGGGTSSSPFFARLQHQAGCP